MQNYAITKIKFSKKHDETVTYPFSGNVNTLFQELAEVFTHDGDVWRVIVIDSNNRTLASLTF